MTFLIGVAGGTASGKTSVCKEIMRILDGKRVAILSLDSFYRSLTEDEHANVATYNFDSPCMFILFTFLDPIVSSGLSIFISCV